MTSTNDVPKDLDDPKDSIVESSVTIPAAPSACPQGLEALLPLDSVLIQQQFNDTEMLESKIYTFSIFAPDGTTKIFSAQENTDFTTLNCCCAIISSKPLSIQMFDVNDVCTNFNCSTTDCGQDVKAYDSSGVLLGTVAKASGCLRCCCCMICFCRPVFEVLDNGNNPIFRIHSPVVCCVCKQALHFPVMGMDDTTNIGSISKTCDKLIKDQKPGCNIFQIQFPLDLDVKLKATLIAGSFLLDFMFFETNPNSNGILMDSIQETS